MERDFQAQDLTTRPVEEEVDRSQKRREKEKCPFGQLPFAFNERKRANLESGGQFEVQGGDVVFNTQPIA